VLGWRALQSDMCVQKQLYRVEFKVKEIRMRQLCYSPIAGYQLVLHPLASEGNIPAIQAAKEAH